MAVVYYTDHPLNQRVSQAVAHGSGATMCHVNRAVEYGLKGPGIVYGVLRGTAEVMKALREVGEDFYHIDHAYFNRVSWSDSGTLESGHFRVTRNALSLHDIDQVEHFSPYRFLSSGVKIKPLRMGNKIVICPPPDRFFDNHPFVNTTVKEWTETVYRVLSESKGREVIVKTKNDDYKLSDLFNDCFCVVSHSSNACIEAALNGIYPITTYQGLLDFMSVPLSKIETISSVYPDHFHDMVFRAMCIAANNQFTLKELEESSTWEALLGEGIGEVPNYGQNRRNNGDI